MADIIYTKVDEAPELASASLLPIIKAFAKPAGITIGTKDISLAGRILANLPQYLTDAQKQPDDLAELGRLVIEPDANVIKLPNISASQPQLNAAIKELQAQGYAIPSYPDAPATDEEKAVKAIYDAIKGSAVNPVLREGNSDRRAPKAVKEFAKKNPHSMGAWAPTSKTHVATMGKNDFAANEKSVTIAASSAGTARIEHVAKDGTVTVLKNNLKLDAGDVLDGTFLSAKALDAFLAAEIADAKAQGILFSVHLKATMMKVSDPIIFGQVVKAFLKDFFAKHGATLAAAGVNPDLGLGDLEAKLAALPNAAELQADLKAALDAGPALYMVNSDKGITNLHVSSDVIIDASMPALIRAGGKGWGPDGKEHDTKCVIPDSSYAGVYDAVIEFCKKNGALDPSKMGTVPNVGLMAQKAEEYGSHPQTFKAASDGTIRIVDAAGTTLIAHEVEAGDIWRACLTKDAPIRDWVKLGVSRARLSGMPGVFWLDKARAHDAELIKKVEAYLPEHDTSGLDLQIMSPSEAARYSTERIAKGLYTISITGNVLRDYLTDLYPILEVGTSAKMLSIVPLMNGGGMYETGAGGSAPKHVQQLTQENHLRWDSLGEFLALAVSLEELGIKEGNARAKLLAKTLDAATGKLLDNNKSPSPKTGELDNRGSQFYLAMYWAQELATQKEDAELAANFAKLSKALTSNEAQIVAELKTVQGKPVDIGGYYKADSDKCKAVMRPSPTLNAALKTARV